jgi:hypothetical protein
VPASVNLCHKVACFGPLSVLPKQIKLEDSEGSENPGWVSGVNGIVSGSCHGVFAAYSTFPCFEGMVGRAPFLNLLVAKGF